MADSTSNKSTGGAADKGADKGAFDEAVARGQEVFETTEARIRELNEQIIASAKKNSLASLDTYEKALSTMLEFETKAADATQIDFVSAVAKAHVSFVNDISSAFTNAARGIIK